MISIMYHRKMSLVRNWLNRKRKWLILSIWLILWQIMDGIIGNSILFVGPIQTAQAFLTNILEANFWITILGSLSRIGAGFLLGLLLGLALAAFSYHFLLVEEIVAPVITLMKTVPVASFVVLLLIWWGSEFLSVAISFLVVLPNCYIPALEGIKSLDPKLLEMARIFHLPFWNRFFYLYRPAVRPFLDSALKIALGMCWKSGIAAEVIGTPDFSIGERLYLSKIYLETADVFAWSATIILLSFLSEKVLFLLWNSFCHWMPKCRAPKQGEQIVKFLVDKETNNASMKLVHVTKEYNKALVLGNLNMEFLPHSITILTQPSGSGKTTLLRILAGVEQVWEGTVRRCHASMVFQEDRLCEEYSAVQNVSLITGDPKQAREHLLKLLPAESLDKPCSQLSGGMKRRVVLVRAMLAPSQAVLLDEPFNGMDEENRQKAVQYLIEQQKGRLLIIATHYAQAAVKDFHQFERPVTIQTTPFK